MDFQGPTLASSRQTAPIWNREFLFLNPKNKQAYHLRPQRNPRRWLHPLRQKLSTAPTRIDTTVQQAWLLKVDSEGCLVPNCHVSTQELPQNSLQFSLYPNPASDFLNILFKGKATSHNDSPPQCQWTNHSGSGASCKGR